MEILDVFISTFNVRFLMEQLTCRLVVMTASYSMARMSCPELNMDGAPSRNLSISLKAAWAPSLDWNLSTS